MFKYSLLIFVAAATLSSITTAQEVYKNVDKQGIVEFSDKAQPGSKAVAIDPNVVDVTPVKPIEPSSSISPKTKNTPAGNMQPEAIQEDTASGYHGDANNRTEARRKLKERLEQGEKPVHLPATPGTGHKPVQGGGRRR